MDDAIAAIGAKVNTLTRPTLVIFMSDNGAAGGDGGSNKPFCKGKASLYEGGIRVPFIARMNGVLPAGKVITQPISYLDVLPTVAALANAAPPPKPLDGSPTRRSSGGI